MPVDLPIYLDNNATTRCDPRVVDAMLPYFTEKFGNAASRNHQFGWEAEDGVDLAREQVAKLIGATAKEVIWTSGSTESNNLAIKGAAEMYKDKGKHIISAVHEHKAVLDPCKRLIREGYEVTWLEPGEDGVIYAEQVREAIREDTILVTVMWANNELGTVNEIPEIGAICKEKGVLFHTDATQWVGKMPTNVEEAGVDLLSASAHKLYGPKGVGCLYVRRRKPRVRLSPLFDGGGHERGMRSGTLNVTGIVGMGAACEIAGQSRWTPSRNPSCSPPCATRLDRGHPRRARHHGGRSTATRPRRLPGTTANISFPYVEGESLMMAIKEIAVSSGSACTSASPRAELRAQGARPGRRDSRTARSASGVGRFNTEEEIDYTIDKVVKNVRAPAGR